MTRPDNNSSRLRVGHLNPRQPTPFTLQPNAATRKALAEELGLIALPRVTFTGQITPELNDAWKLSGKVSARVTQSCVVTLEAVSSDVTEEVERLFTPHLSAPEGEEMEMPDDTLEPLGQFIDLDAIMAESLSLSLPLYPRAKGADLPDEVVPDQDEPTEDTRRPFAGLAGLLSQKRD